MVRPCVNIGGPVRFSIGLRGRIWNNLGKNRPLAMYEFRRSASSQAELLGANRQAFPGGVEGIFRIVKGEAGQQKHRETAALAEITYRDGNISCGYRTVVF